MEQFLDKSLPFNQQAILVKDIDQFFESINAGLVNNDSSAYFKALEENDYADVFNIMLKDR